MVVVDAHNHLDDDRKRGTFQTADILVKRLDRFGIDTSVIMPNPLDTITGIDEPNNLILEAVKKYPERFIGFCCVNPLFKDKAVREIERCLNLGFKGIGEIVPDVYEVSADDETIISLIRKVENFDLPILFHVGDTPYCRPRVIEKVILNLPENVIIMGHMGAWNRLVDDVISIAKRFEKVYLDTAHVGSVAMMKKALDELGAERIVFGSDSFTDEEMQTELHRIEVLALAKREKNLIMSENIVRLLKLER